MAAAGSAPELAALYVGDLHADVTEAMLYEIFNAVGPVASIRVCRDNVTRRSFGYAYVNFHTKSDAERALDTLNYSSIRGRSCRLMWAQKDSGLRRRETGNIYVKNLDKTIDNKALYDTFSLFGNILSCKVASDSEGNSHGYGFVHYETEDSAKQAIERVNGMQIGGKTVQVCTFVKREERPQREDTYTNLYIKGFPDDWDEDKLVAEMAEFGPIKASALRTDKSGRRMGFVEFEATEDAQKCVEKMHLKELRTEEALAAAKEKGEEDKAGPDGHVAGKLFVQRVVPRRERENQSKALAAKGRGMNLYVKNLGESTDDAALLALFEPFGSVTSAHAPKDEQGRAKGFGFVTFASNEDATAAVTGMHLKVVSGKPLYVSLAEKREARQERLRQLHQQGPQPTGKGGGGGKPAGAFPTGPGLALPGPLPSMPMEMFNKGGPQMFGKGGPQMFGKGGPQMMPMMPPNMMGMVRPGMMPQQMMGMGMMRPGMMQGGKVGMMPGMMQGGAMPGMMGMMRPPAVPKNGGGMPPNMMPRPPLTAAMLAAVSPSVQKQMIGERLYTAIVRFQPQLAGKITGMMLEMDNSELLLLLESDPHLKQKVEDALKVLNQGSKSK